MYVANAIYAVCAARAMPGLGAIFTSGDAVFCMQCCLASDSGREAAVCALASCPAALRRLCGLVGLHSKVLAAAAGTEDEAQELVSALGMLLRYNTLGVCCTVAAVWADGLAQ
jgi:hypothetical protein